LRATPWGPGLLAVLLLTAVPALMDGAAAGDTPGARAAADRPAVGECRVLTYAQTRHRSDSTDPVACSQSHTDRVIAVADLPGGTTWSGLTDAQVTRLGVSTCTPAFRTALGQNDKVRDRTAYAWIFFEPTDAQQTAGAAWIRCDLVLLRGHALRSLPTDAAPALTSAAVPTGVRRCLTGQAHNPTVCSAGHDFRATGAFTLTGRYPGDAEVARVARQRCPARVSTPGRFLFTHQAKLTWNRQHDHAVVCFSHRSD